MRIIALSTLKSFWKNNTAYTDAIDPTLAWYRHTLKANWDSPNAVKEKGVRANKNLTFKLLMLKFNYTIKHIRKVHENIYRYR